MRSVVMLLRIVTGLAMVVSLLVTPTTFAGHVGPGITGGADVKVTDDNGNVDGGLAATTPSKDARNRQSTEPSMAISPRPSPVTGRVGDILAASSIDHRMAPFFGEAWQGLYLSFDGGQTWFGAPPFPNGYNTMIPGFPTDTSAAGLASPLKNLDASFDPIVRFDTAGNLYLAGIAFRLDLDQPDRSVDNTVYVARYAFTPGTAATPSTPASAGSPPHFTYGGTSLVDRGTHGYVAPNPFGTAGEFNDEEWMEIDTNPAAASPCAGSIYVAYTSFHGNTANNLVGQFGLRFSRSTDGGRSFSSGRTISTGGQDGTVRTEGAGIAIAPNGTVYVTYRTFATFARRRPETEAMFVVKSTNCGQTWTNPVLVGTFNDPGGFGSPPGTALLRAPALGYIATDSVNSNIVYLVYQNFVGTDYDIYVQRSVDGGATWGPPVQVNEDPGGRHQIFPTIRVSNSALHVAWYDFRNSVTPVNEALDVYYACTNCTGNVYPAFSHNVRITDVSHQANCRMFFDGQVAFHGDYFELAARWNGSNHVVHIIWTDNRDVPAAQCDLDDAPGPPTNSIGNRNQNLYTDRIVVAP